jgi:hypothetical protein
MKHIVRPVYQAPANKGEFAAWLFRMLADYRNRLGRSNVVARLPIFFAGGVEVVGDELLCGERVGNGHTYLGEGHASVTIKA